LGRQEGAGNEFLLVIREDRADQAVLVATRVIKDALDNGRPTRDGAYDGVFCDVLVHSFVLDIRLLKLGRDG
jgi:hypothetical protein